MSARAPLVPKPARAPGGHEGERNDATRPRPVPHPLHTLQRRAGNRAVAELLQRRLAGTDGHIDTRVVDRALVDGSSGRPLDAGVREQMETSFGRSFEGVRVHADTNAAGLARALKADAFTRGRDVYFGDGAYDPSSDAGRRLLAHELAHTVQQESAPVTREALTSGDDPAEREAATIAERISAGVPAPPPVESPAALARQEPVPVPVPTPTATPNPTESAQLEPDPIADPIVREIIDLLSGYTSQADSAQILRLFAKQDAPTIRSIMRRLRAKGVEWLLGDLTPGDRQQLRIVLSRAQTDVKPQLPEHPAPPPEKVDEQVVNDAVDTIMEALLGPTGWSGSGRILAAFTEKSPETVRAILQRLKDVAPADMSPEQMIDWLFSDMIAEDRRELRSLLSNVAPEEDLVRIAAGEIADLLSGYTSEEDSREIFQTITQFTGSGLELLLSELESRVPGTPDEPFEVRLFDDLDAVTRRDLRKHFFRVSGEKPASYAAIYTARTVESLIAGYTSHADARSIIENVTGIEEPVHRDMVQTELELRTQERWQKSASDVLMENMSKDDYEELRAVKGLSLKEFVETRSWIERYAVGTFEVVADVVEILAGAVIGIVLGIVEFIFGILGLVVDLVKAVIWLVMSFVYLITGGAVGGGFWLDAKEFFKGIAQLFAHPIDVLGAAWDKTVAESETIEGPFEYGRRTAHWVSLIVVFVANVYFFIRGAAAIGKSAAGIAAEAQKIGYRAALLQAGKSVVSSGSKILAKTGEVAAALLKNLRPPIAALRTVAPRISRLLAATNRENVWKFLREKSGLAVKEETKFWKDFRETWRGKAKASQAKHGELTDKSEQLEQRLESDQPAPEDPQAIDDVADDANKLDDDVGRQEEDVLGRKQEPDQTAPAPVIEPRPKLPAPGTILAEADSEAALMDAYLEAAARAAPENVEVGIYVQARPGQPPRYAVAQGRKGAVSPPAGEGWSNVSHFHPDAPSDPGYHNPAPQDLTGALNEYARNPRGGPVRQKVHSRTPTGELYEVVFGIDAEAGGYFVQLPGQEPMVFKGLWPDSLDAAVNEAAAIADDAKKIQRLRDIFRNLDEREWYGAWWSRRFTLGVTPTSGGGGFRPPPTGGAGGTSVPPTVPPVTPTGTGGTVPPTGGVPPVPPAGGGGGGTPGGPAGPPPVLLWVTPTEPVLVSEGTILPWPARRTLTGNYRLFGAGGEALSGPPLPRPPLVNVRGQPLPLTPRTGPLILDIQSGTGTELPRLVLGTPGARGVGLETGDWLLGYRRLTTTDPRDLDYLRRFVAQTPIWPETPVYRTPIERTPTLLPWEQQPGAYLWPEGPGLVTTMREPFFPARGGTQAGGERLIPYNLEDVTRLVPTQHPELYGQVAEIYLRRPFGFSRADEATIVEAGRELNRMLEPGGFVELRVRIGRDLLVPEAGGPPSADQLTTIANQIDGARVVTVDRATIKAFARDGVIPADPEQAAILARAAADIKTGGLGEGLYTLIARIYKGS
jgi:Domain of unknown function (DUF4157)